MNAVIYYGAPARAGQRVSDEVAAKGISFLRSTPSAAYPLVTRNINTPQYSIYVGNFGAAARAAEENMFIAHTNFTVYYVPKKLYTPVYQRTPVVVWSYDRTMTSDALAGIRERFNAAETVSNKKPAFMASLSPTQVAGLINDTTPSQTTASSTTNMNIRTYRAYLRLHKIADFFFRIHQYPLASTPAGLTNYFNNSIQVTEKLTSDSMSTYGKDSTEYKVYNGRNLHSLRFNMNLPNSDLSTVKYTIQSAADLTSDHLLIFPFQSDLAREDHDMVLSVLNRYLMPLLGSNAAEALSTYNDFKETWGNLRITLWGDELAHIYSAIRFAFESGTTIRIITTPNNLYQGFIAMGAGYTAYQWGIEYAPVTNTVFASQFIKASPHASSLAVILDIVNFPDDMERQAAKGEIHTIQELAVLIREHGFNVNKEEQLRLAARHLTFPNDNYLPITAHNVTRVLTAMTSDESEEHFPLHANAILERDRRKRLLSSFGAMVPSFNIPGGRGIGLDGSFTYNVVEKGKKEAKSTTRMFCTMVPFAKGCTDLDALLVNHMVYSPIGTPLAGRASSFSMIREFSGTGGITILGALRALCGVAMVGNPDGGKGKRKAEEVEGGPRKRQNLADEF